MRSIEQISHTLDSYADLIRPERDVRRMRALAQAVTDDGKVRLDRTTGFLPPHAIPLDAMERGYLVDIDPPSIAAGAVGIVTVAVATAEENDAVMLGAPSTLETGLLAFGFVSAPGIVTIRMFNGTAGAVDPVSNTWRVVVTR